MSAICQPAYDKRVERIKLHTQIDTGVIIIQAENERAEKERWYRDRGQYSTPASEDLFDAIITSAKIASKLFEGYEKMKNAEVYFKACEMDCASKHKCVEY